MDAGRAHCVGITFEFLPAISPLVVADDQVARHQENLLPIFVDEGLGRVDAGRETQKSGAVAASGFFVERAGYDFLLDARRITGRRVPALIHVEAVEFLMSLVKTHRFLPNHGRATSHPIAVRDLAA